MTFNLAKAPCKATGFAGGGLIADVVALGKGGGGGGLTGDVVALGVDGLAAGGVLKPGDCLAAGCEAATISSSMLPQSMFATVSEKS